MASPRAVPGGYPTQGDILAGKYQIEGVIGSGGMGMVVSAVHVTLRQRVAVKFLLPEAGQLADAGARFLREAQAAAAIQSEHVTRVLDIGTLDNGAPYMVMEHLQGADLWRLLRGRGPLPVDEATDYILQVCEVLAEAHALGIVHRDLKLANIFLTTRSDGSPLIKVLDFGLSKWLLPEVGVEEGLTMTNLIIGSPHYMSPEQIRSLKHVDTRTDIWALGVILYQLLTAQRPFKGDNLAAVCMSIAIDTPPAMGTLVADLPVELDQLVQRCLEKDIDRRVATVAELARGLSPFAPPSAQVSVDRVLGVAAGKSTGSRSFPAVRVPAPAPTPPPQSLRSEILPWLRTFDDFLRSHRDELQLSEATWTSVRDSKARLEEASARLDERAAATRTAEATLKRAEAMLGDAHQQRSAMEATLHEARRSHNQAAEEARGHLRPLLERLLEHDDMTNVARRQLGLVASPSAGTAVSSSAPGIPFTPLAVEVPSAPISRATPPAPAPPETLAVQCGPNRVSVLQWGDGGNGPGTSYLIEAAVGTLYRGSPRVPEASAYQLVATVTDTTVYTHTASAAPVGAWIKYRVRARHDRALSGLSNEVMVTCK